MKKDGKKSWLRGVKWVLLGVLVLFIVTPYLFPISVPQQGPVPLPFGNSAIEVVKGTSFHYRTYQPKNSAVKGKLLLVHGLAGSTFSFEVSAASDQ